MLKPKAELSFDEEEEKIKGIRNRPIKITKQEDNM